MEVQQYKNKVIKLNIGEESFTTTTNTLMKRDHDSLLYNLASDYILYNVSKDKSNFKQHTDYGQTIFIDRNGDYFHVILNYLQNGTIDITSMVHNQHDGIHILNDAKYYKLTGLISLLLNSEKMRNNLMKQKMLR